VRDGHQPRFDVGVLGQVGIGPQCRQKRLGPRVLGVDGADDRATDPQHRGAVAGHYLFERTHLHIR
jgi:hypothetical protein